MLSRRSVFTVSTRGFSISAGQGPIVLFHVVRISVRRRDQSSAVFTGLPSLNKSGERNLPRSPRYFSGGWKNCSNSACGFGASALRSAEPLVSAIRKISRPVAAMHCLISTSGCHQVRERAIAARTVYLTTSATPTAGLGRLYSNPENGAKHHIAAFPLQT